MQVIPLKPNSKTPVFDRAVESWQSVAPGEQWQRLGSDFRGNIAAVPGNGVAVLDADDTQAVSSLTAFTAGLGLKLPRVLTVSDGCYHFWLRVSGAPAEFSYSNLSPEVGDGELRVSRCYVAVPCSAIGERRYKFVSGSPESLAALKPVRWQDLLSLIQRPSAKHEFERLPVRLVRREIPERAAALLEALSGAPEGEQIDKYPSRSEAEAAVVACLVLAGWTKSEIRQVFELEQPAHFTAAGRSKGRYFDTTYANVLNELCNTPERLELAQLYQQVESLAWPGRAGGLNRATFRALLAVAWQFASFQVEASERVLAEHAASTQPGVSRALKRLERMALVQVKRSPHGIHATRYNIEPSRFGINSHSISTIGDCAHAYQDTEQVSAVAGCTSSGALTWQSAEVFSVGKLGRSAELVLRLLSDEGQTVSELARLTAKNWHTIKRALKRLELNELATDTGSGWVRGSALLGLVADDFEARERAVLRRSRHERERQAWRECSEMSE